MARLTVENFLSAGSDFELAKYRVLAALKSYSDDFNHNRLYPGLRELIELQTSLQNLVHEQSKFLNRLPQDLKKMDLLNHELEYEAMDLSCRPVDHVIGLIRWALDPITQTIDEGTRIYDFVEDNLSIKEVGILPIYHDEGYWFVPDNRSSLLHIIHFQIALYESGNESFRSLKTWTIRSLEQSIVQRSAESIKLELIEEYHELPNPATYVCHTDLDFPFAETILPVANRKLMRRLAA